MRLYPLFWLLAMSPVTAGAAADSLFWGHFITPDPLHPRVLRTVVAGKVRYQTVR